MMSTPTSPRSQLGELPTHKLLPLISQLTCRLGAETGDGNSFQDALRQVSSAPPCLCRTRCKSPCKSPGKSACKR